MTGPSLMLSAPKHEAMPSFIQKISNVKVSSPREYTSNPYHFTAFQSMPVYFLARSACTFNTSALIVRIDCNAT